MSVFVVASPDSPLGGVRTVAEHPLRPRVDAPLPEVDEVLPGLVPPHAPAPDTENHFKIFEPSTFDRNKSETLIDAI